MKWLQTKRTDNKNQTFFYLIFIVLWFCNMVHYDYQKLQQLMIEIKCKHIPGAEIVHQNS